MEIDLNSHVYMSIDIGGTSVPFITDAVIVMFIITAVIVLAVVLCTRKLSLVPSKVQNAAEILIDFVNNLSRNQIGRHYKPFAPFLCTFLLFLALSNTVAIFNIFPHFSMHPPTKNFNVALCLAIVTIVTVIFAEFRYKGFRGWLKSFYTPTPISAFVKLLDYVVRPLSLCLRLFGNILGGYIAMSLLYSAIPLVLPAFVSMYFDLFDGGLQAYVFIFLTTMYLAESTEEQEVS